MEYISRVVSTKISKMYTTSMQTIHMSPAHYPDEQEFLPALPDHAFIQSWKKNNIGGSIISLMESYTFHVYAVDFIRRPRLLAYLKRESRVNYNVDDSHSVVITLQNLPDPDWKLNDVMGEIHRELVDRLTVEVRVGKVEVFQPRLHLGCSIGLQYDSRSNGTAGGYVDLVDKDGEVVMQCILTCDHVVRPYIGGEDDFKIMRPRSECSEPYLRDQSEQSPILCATPSIAFNEKKVNDNKKEVIRLSGEILGLKNSRNKEPFFQEELQHLKYQRKKLQNEVTKMLARNETFGHVYASSGYSFSRHQHRLDWCLIEVDQALIPKLRRNKVEDLSRTQCESRQILRAIKPRKMALVYKRGSATDTTVGVVNPVQSHVVSFDADSNRRFTEEWCIIPAAGTKVFATAGDSGSLVLERDSANVMGMIFGGHVGGGPVYFTSITAIATHIEKLTGLKVQLPGGRIIGN